MTDAPTPAPAPAPAPAPTSWVPATGVDAELSGHIQNHGWEKLPAADAALAAAKSHREAAKLIGVPQDKIVRIAEPNDEVGRKAMWAKLGTPGDPKEYGIEGMKRSDGTALDPKLQDFMRTTFAAALLPKDTAARVGSELVKFLDGQAVSAAAERTAKLKEGHDALDKNWGANKEANLFIAKNAAAKLAAQVPGIQEAVTALETQIGYDKVMEMFRVLGVQMGEARFVANGSPGSPAGGVMSKDQAVARKAELSKDQAWTTRYLNGDAEAKREMLALNTIITSGQSFNQYSQ